MRIIIYPFLYRNEKREYLNNKNIIQPGTKLDQSAILLDENSYQKFIQNDYVPDLMFKEVLSFVDENKENNFLMMWATPLPHVPLQAPNWPSKIKSVSISSRVAAWDVIPTFAEILEMDAATDGISFLPELTGKEQIETHDYLYWEFPENNGLMAIRMDRWKGIIENVHNGNKNTHLFDLAKQHPDIVNRLEEKILEAHVRADVEKFRFCFEKCDSRTQRAAPFPENAALDFP